MWCAILTVLALGQQPDLSLEDIQIRDPFVLAVADTKTYYLYGTGRPLGEPGFDAYKSKDLVHWEGPFAVFRPTPDYWGQRDFWAPEVHPYKGRFYMFATFSPSGEGPRGTAILVADAPEGPFVPHSDGPVTPADWYALDGTLFIDDEQNPWMVFCHEWVQIGDGAMCAVRLAEDLSHAVGEPVNLFHASRASWGIESSFHDKPGRVTDGPWIERLPGGGLFMLWSTFGEESAYSVGSARSASGKITGPWEVQQDRIYTDDGGHPMIFKTFEGKRVMSLHQPNKSKRERARLLDVHLSDLGIAILEPLDPVAAKPSRGIPTPEQLAWHEMEIQMFLCLDPCTWQGREYDDHSTPLSDINPAQLDTDQWCEAAKSFGAKQILFVAKHTGGFCWWPTQTTEYCVRNIAWKNGQGDVLGELAESCRRHGLKLGVYIYPGDDQWGAGIGSGGKTADPAKQEAYNAVLRQQWTEVLTRYGEVSEIWFDGSCVVELGDIIRQHAPRAMVFQGPHATLRWPGNEKGIAPDPAWQTVLKSDAATGVATGVHSNPDGDVWLPMEMDTTLLDHKWFWAPETDHKIKSLDTLMDVYHKSVGLGCVLLLNATPDTSGRIPESHMARYRGFGAAIAKVYENQIGETSGTGREFQIQFDKPERISHVVIQEDIRRGHTVRRFRIEGLHEDKWQVLARAESIGYKRIEAFDPLELSALRLRITDFVGEPHINKFAAFGSGVKTNAAETPTAAWQKIESWSEIRPSADWQTVEVDLTEAIRLPGEYRVEIRQEVGSPILQTAEAVPLIAGTEAPRLLTQAQEPNAWILRRTDMVTDDARGVTTLRLRIRCASGESCASTFWVRTGVPQ